jgi:hypothetical protein
LSVGTYVLANVFNLQFWPFSYFNPSEIVSIVDRTLEYPTYTLFNIRGPEIVNIHLTLTPNEPLAAGVVARITARGFLNASYINRISQIFVGFVGSSPNSPLESVFMYGFQFPFITLQPTFPLVYYFLGVPLTGNSQQILWESAGDYAPFLVLLCDNGTTIPETYPYLSVHVDSADVARMERYNRVDEALSVALVLFGFVEGYGILYDIDEKRVQRHDSTNAPNFTLPRDLPFITACYAQ